MAKKSKEKELTREEAIKLARAQLAPLWFGSSPLLLGIRSPQGATVHPIDPEFAQKRWMLALLDPLRFSGPGMLDSLIRMHYRYETYGVDTLLILSESYPFFREPGMLEQFSKSNRLPFPFTLDPDGALFAAFGADVASKVLLVAEGKLLLDASGPGWMRSLEEGLQKFLRQDDPGLALFEPFTVQPSGAVDTRAIDFAQTKRPAHVELSGEWIQEADRISTSDPRAVLSFDFEGSELAIIARGLGLLGQAGEIVVEVNGMAVREMSWGGDMERMDTGGGLLVHGPRAYHAISKLGAGKGRIGLKFPHAGRAGVALYGARFGKSGDLI